MASLKAQAFSLDLIAAYAISLLTLAYFIILWGSLVSAQTRAGVREEIDLAALSVSDILVASPGYPEDWPMDPENAGSLGLAATPNVLAPYKVAAFSAMEYAYVKQGLGVTRDVFIRIESPEGVRYATAGIQPNATLASSEVRRLALMNGAPVVVRVQVYAGN